MSGQGHIPNEMREDRENHVFGREHESEYIGDYEVLGKLGEGTYGKVFLVRDVFDEKMAAMKTMKKQRIWKKNNIEDVKNEFEIMKGLDSPFFPKLLAVFHSTHSVNFVVELCQKGNFSEVMEFVGAMTEQEVRFYMSEFLLGLQYLHGKHVIHQDLKLANLLLTEGHHLKICDLGLSQPGVTENTKLTRKCGSQMNMSPEKFKRQEYTILADWWCFALILVQLFGYKHPFSRASPSDRVVAIQNAMPEYNKNSELADDLPVAARHLADSLLDFESLRLKPALIPAHPFFEGVNFDDIENQRVPPPQFAPNLRPTLQRNSNTDENGNGREPSGYADFHVDDAQFSMFTYKRS